jgi:hypothetical protein
LVGGGGGKQGHPTQPTSRWRGERDDARARCRGATDILRPKGRRRDEIREAGRHIHHERARGTRRGVMLIGTGNFGRLRPSS